MIIRDPTIIIGETHIDIASGILEIDVYIEKLGICICGIQVYINDYDSVQVQLPEIFSTIESRPSPAIRFLCNDDKIDFKNNLIKEILKIKWMMEFLKEQKTQEKQ